jgi:small subunit ribosomal protein S8
VDLNVNSGDTQPRKATLISQKPKNKLTLVSKPGKRIYVGYRDLKDFNHGFKTYILRTSKGIITSQTAIKLKIGGELLIKV